MSFTVFLGNLPEWVTADDIKSWLAAENLVADHVKVIRNLETQESKGFAFIEAPNKDEMQAIIRRFDRAPLEDRLLRANQAQPPRSKRPVAPAAVAAQPAATQSRTDRPPLSRERERDRDRKRPAGGEKKRGGRGGQRSNAPHSAFAEELAKVL